MCLTLGWRPMSSSANGRLFGENLADIAYLLAIPFTVVALTLICHCVSYCISASRKRRKGNDAQTLLELTEVAAAASPAPGTLPLRSPRRCAAVSTATGPAIAECSDLQVAFTLHL